MSDIGACNEEDEADGTEQNEERRFNVANYLFVERDHHRASPLVVVGILLREPTGNCFHLDLRLLQSHSRFQARYYFKEMISTLRCFLLRKRHRHPELIIAG